tara:strand:+ start:5560 stop:6255 length:696 start_codon:yes stop_codon:yes gene_type:complete
MSKVIVDEIQTDTTNGNVRVIPNGTGALEVKGAGGDDAMLQLNCSAQSHGVKIKSPAHSAGQSYTMILPDNNVTADKVLKVKSITGSGATAIGQLEFGDAGDLSGLLKEGVKITAGKLSDNLNIDLADGMVHYFTTQETTTSTPNIRFSSSATLDSNMSVGEAISVTLITTAAAAAYSAQLTIDGAAVTENWVGGSAPSDGGSSGVDIHAYTIIKTGSATFTVIANQSKTS